MKEKIIEVENYFKSKLLSNDFEIKEIKECTLSLSIDNKYIFTIWIGNFDLDNYIELYEGGFNYISLKFNLKEKVKLKSVIKKPVNEWRRNVLLREKRKEFNRLKKELSL